MDMNVVEKLLLDNGYEAQLAHLTAIDYVIGKHGQEIDDHVSDGELKAIQIVDELLEKQKGSG